MTKASILALLAAIALAAPAVAQDAISQTIKLGQSGPPGERPDPDCGDGTGISSAEVWFRRSCRGPVRYGKRRQESDR